MGTATNGRDYVTLTGPLTIPAGAASATVTVTPINDEAVEGSETVVVTLQPGPGYALGTSSGTVTLTSEDVNPTVTLVVADASALVQPRADSSR